MLCLYIVFLATPQHSLPFIIPTISAYSYISVLVVDSGSSNICSVDWKKQDCVAFARVFDQRHGWRRIFSIAAAELGLTASPSDRVYHLLSSQ